MVVVTADIFVTLHCRGRPNCSVVVTVVVTVFDLSVYGSCDRCHLRPLYIAAVAVLITPSLSSLPYRRRCNGLAISP
ncbi:hypothetical protein EDB83DRAFT_2365924 [Lactarius deliciosus]|nr:hypothetical protein EDB83DRAFT_2365924 [Lactarius deliciosus]